jgi:hypothetical protein
MRRQLGQVAGRPPALPQGLTSEPGDHPDDIHGGRREELLEVRACYKAGHNILYISAE